MPRIVRLSFAGDDDQEGADRQTASLAGLAVALLLVVIGLFLVRQLHAKAAIEDCLLSGRSNCDLVMAAVR
jgi:uncharacterized membrane protein